MKSFLLFCLLLILPTFNVIPALAQNPPSLETDPQHLQQQAIARIEHCIEHVRKTGDFASLRPELEKADQELKISSELFLRHGDQANAALSLIKRGDALRLLYRWEQAVKMYHQALGLARQADNPGYQAKALIGMGRAEDLGLKQFDEAARHFQEVITLSERFGNQEDLANALDYLAQVQEKRGELTAASDTINRAAAVAEKLKDPKLLLFIYMDRGEIYLKFAAQCDYKAAFRVCYDYLDQSKADYTRFLKIAQDLGYQGLVKYGQEALEHIESRRALLKHHEGFLSKFYTDNEKLFQPQGPKDVLVNERFVPALPKLPPQVQELIQQSKQGRTLAEATGQRPSQNPSRVALEGDFLRHEGKPDEALSAYLKAVELLERDRGRLRDEEARGSYMEDKIDIYYKPIPFLLEQRRYAEAFDLLERSRSRVMADLLATRDLEIQSDQGRELYAQYRDLKADIARLQKDLHRRRSQPGRPPDPAEIAELERQILHQEKKFQNLEARISREAPRLQELLVAKPASLQELQESMRRDNYEVIEYMEGVSTVIVWHITADAVQVKSVFLPPEQLEQKVKKLRASISDKEQTFDATMARQLFLYLIEPVKADVKQERVVIIPYGVLNRIPFQVLQDPQDGRFPGERWQISYAPNATILVKSKKSTNLQGESLLAVADPEISEAPKEVEAIAALFPGKNKQVTGLVKEADLKSWAGDYSVLHLSVHGKFEAEALLSYLVLNKGTPAEWHLTAAAMFGLPLAKTRLVVLSACETGQVEATHANELYGMIRALIYAGANTLILSAWEVDAASTRLWMETFYKNAQTQPLGEAARQAIQAVKKQPQYQHPFYWAPFLMFGK